jgi:hypothetical protein
MQLLMADSMRDHENRVNGTGRRRTMDDNPAFRKLRAMRDVMNELWILSDHLKF